MTTLYRHVSVVVYYINTLPPTHISLSLLEPTLFPSTSLEHWTNCFDCSAPYRGKISVFFLDYMCTWGGSKGHHSPATVIRNLFHREFLSPTGSLLALTLCPRLERRETVRHSLHTVLNDACRQYRAAHRMTKETDFTWERADALTSVSELTLCFFFCCCSDGEASYK